MVGRGGETRSGTGRGAEREGEVNGHDNKDVSNSARRWPQAPFQQREGRVDFHCDVIRPDRITAESIANFAGIDLMTIAYKEAGGGGREAKERRWTSGSNPFYIWYVSWQLVQCQGLI